MAEPDTIEEIIDLFDFFEDEGCITISFEMLIHFLRESDQALMLKALDQIIINREQKGLKEGEVRGE